MANNNPKVKVAKDPMNNECKKVFIRLYNDNFGVNYAWNGVEGKMLNSVLNKLRQQVDTETMDKIGFLLVFEHFIARTIYLSKNDKRYEWLYDNFTLSLISKHFNPIWKLLINNKNNGKSKTSGGTSKEELANHLNQRYGQDS